ncbi:glycosyltransferase [Patescibacteria group bacterium]|nr:glycosyltransferase [Patescibacteria group bacterium]
MAKVSVIIPTYNSERFIERTIKTVLAQTFQGWEMIIVDDCSSDRTKDIVKDYERKDKRIKGVFLDRNSGGPSYPTNVGVNSSGGEYIALLDHDDEWLPDKIEKQMLILENKPDVGIVSCDCVIKNDDGKEIGIRDNVNHVNVLHDELFCNFVFGCSSVLIRKNVFDAVEGFDEKCRVSQDWEFYIRVFEDGFGFDFVPERLFISHPVLKSSQWKGISYLKRAEEMKYILDKHRKLFLDDSVAFKNRLRRLGGLYIFSRKYIAGLKYLFKSL